MIRTLIIEDESPAARRLSKMIQKQQPDADIETVLDSVENSVEWLQQHPHPDLIFADIQLGDGLSFSIFEQVPTESFLIFTTAYDEYAIRAFEHNSIDYLLKPINAEKLSHALAKFEKLRRTKQQPDMTAIMDFIAQEKKSYKTHFWVSIAARMQKIETQEIVYINSTDKSTFVHTENGRSLTVDYSLDQLERILDPEQFFRINRQVLIHFTNIDQIEMLSKSRLKVKMKTKTEEDLIVSSGRQSNFKQWLDR